MNYRRAGRIAVWTLVVAIIPESPGVLAQLPPQIKDSRPRDLQTMPRSQVKELRVLLAGEAFFNRATQEAVMLAVPWGQMVSEFFPRRSVPVVVEYDNGDGPPSVVAPDARDRPFDPDRARVLLREAGFDQKYSQVRLRLLCQPDVCDTMNWLRPFLDKAGLAPMEPAEVRELRQPFSDRAVLWLGRR